MEISGIFILSATKKFDASRLHCLLITLSFIFSVIHD